MEAAAPKTAHNPAPVIHANRKSAGISSLLTKETLLAFSGFTFFMASTLIYENYLLFNNVAVFNYGLYGGIAGLLACLVIAALGVTARYNPSRWTVMLCALAASISMTVQLVIGSGVWLCAICSAIHGATCALLALTWGKTIAQETPRTIFVFVLGALLISTALSMLCFMANNSAATLIALVFPAASGALYVKSVPCDYSKRDGIRSPHHPKRCGSDRAAKRSGGDAVSSTSIVAGTSSKVSAGACTNASAGMPSGACTSASASISSGTSASASANVPANAPANQLAINSRALKSFPWSYLLLLAGCCLLSSFFVGIALNPYIFQSNSVSDYMYLFTSCTLAGLLLCALLFERPRVQMFFIAALVLLFIGLFLFSTGLLGSIIAPLGLILAAKNLCVALCWITCAILSKVRAVPVITLFGVGLFVASGTLGRSIGMMANNGIALSFPDIALVASLCIVVFTLFYTFTVASHPKTNQALAFDAHSQTSRAFGANDPFASKGEFSTNEPDTLTPSDLEACGLTAQELRVAKLILQGKTYKDIAEFMGITDRTIKFHAKNIFQKTGVISKAEFMSKMLSDDTQE